jgi:hypothetical protein
LTREPAPGANRCGAGVGERHAREHGTELASVEATPRREGGVTMRAIGLYLLGVPVFVIVILWLFGIV